jgi:hypothetical protein
MKKILVVLALLFVCGMAFSVTGSVYVRLNASGSVTATEWGTLDDLSTAGRRGSGFDINFENFGISYKLRSAVTPPTAVKNAYGTPGLAISSSGTITTNALTATSPGYVQINGIKLGSATLAIGGTFWHFDENQNGLSTNLAGTNFNLAANIAYNQFAFNSYFSIPISDTMKLENVPWDQIQLDFGFGTATRNDLGVTNVGNSSMFKIFIPIYLNMTFDKFSLSLAPRLIVGNSSDIDSSTTTTNTTLATSSYFGSMVRAGYSINDNWSFYADIGLFANNSTAYQQVNTATNQNATRNAIDLPLFIGFTFKPAGWTTLNLGIGYLAKLSDTTTDYGNGGTNITKIGGGLANIYHDQNVAEHAYAKPFMSWGGSSKFAEDWTLGMNDVLLLNSPAPFSTGGYYTGYANTTVGTSTTYNASQLVHFDNFWNFDGGGGSAYIQYAKDAVSLKFVFGNGAPTGIMGLFGYVDMSVNF